LSKIYFNIELGNNTDAIPIHHCILSTDCK
jgi:hypothetical protein